MKSKSTPKQRASNHIGASNHIVLMCQQPCAVVVGGVTFLDTVG